jgi:hypothetical protein
MYSGSVVVAETAVHDITAYTSTATGVRELNALATGDESLLVDYPDAIRIDGKGLSTGKIPNDC